MASIIYPNEPSSTPTPNTKGLIISRRARQDKQDREIGAGRCQA